MTLAMAAEYRIYGNLASRDTIVLTSTLMTKGLSADLVEETPSLALELAARSGCEVGPYLRTLDGFVLGGLHSMLNWIERVHGNPPLLPPTPVRRICARLLDDWIDFWLPLWPNRSWATIERIESHLAATGCLLGSSPTRPDLVLAAWIEAEVANQSRGREHLSKRAPALLSFGSRLLEQSIDDPPDDAIPISVLTLLEEIASDYHAYLSENQKALENREPRVVMDLGLGKWGFPVLRESELRRIETRRDLDALSRLDQQAVRRVLEPVGAWRALMLPSILAEPDPSDPRSL